MNSPAFMGVWKRGRSPCRVVQPPHPCAAECLYSPECWCFSVRSCSFPSPLPWGLSCHHLPGTRSITHLLFSVPPGAPGVLLRVLSSACSPPRSSKTQSWLLNQQVFSHVGRQAAFLGHCTGLLLLQRVILPGCAAILVQSCSMVENQLLGGIWEGD